MFEVVKRLELKNWESVVHAWELSLDGWMMVAKLLKARKLQASKPSSQLIARIQCLVVDAGLTSDSNFVTLLYK